jgi:hypothetical protein
MVASQATLQAMWLSSLFESIGVTQMKPIIIYDDNQSVDLYQRTQYFMFTRNI